MNKRFQTNLASDLTIKINSFKKIHNMPGINSGASYGCFIKQLVDSCRRVEYVSAILKRTPSINCANPGHSSFEPLKAAHYHKSQGNIDEAFWLIFLFTHFGKHIKWKWNLLKNVYGKLGSANYWDWNSISNNKNAFRNWLHQNEVNVKANGAFGNHRKYVSIKAMGGNGTGAAILSYIDWIGNSGSHVQKFNSVVNQLNDPKKSFNTLYKELNNVVQFGRTAKFDYLCMLAKMQLIQIEPDSIYLSGATGPKAGAKLMFFGNKDAQVSNATINTIIGDLEQHLGLPFGMQVIEDSLCNWQKSTNNYIYFGG